MKNAFVKLDIQKLVFNVFVMELKIMKFVNVAIISRTLNGMNIFVDVKVDS